MPISDPELEDLKELLEYHSKLIGLKDKEKNFLMMGITKNNFKQSV